MKTSFRLALFGLVIMILGGRDMRRGHDSAEREARYASEGRTVQGEVVSQVETTFTSGKRAKTSHTVYRLAVIFKLPNGIPVSTGVTVDEPVPPSPDGKTWVTLRYLPSDPQASAELAGRVSQEPDGGQDGQSGLLWLGIGVIPVGIACLRERSKLARLFGRRS